ncbi:MAG: hypothetical protein EAZ92_09865 [Candidatus Kapaibacterium sp.]|nr:MAG: hypothetical protein EAZ92_09865 [Candidatus Kapabacteria bacterium]
MLSPCLTAMPSAPTRVETIGIPSDIASTIFKRIPPPLNSGTSSIAWDCRKSAAEGTSGCMNAPCASPKARSSADIRFPAMCISTRGFMRRTSGSTSRTHHCTASIFGCQSIPPI